MDLTWNEDASRRALAIACASELGTEISRNSLLWHKIEPKRGQRDWNLPDSVVEGLTGAGIEPLWCVYGSPRWTNGSTGLGDDCYLSVPDGTAWLSAYVDFLRSAARRYRGKVSKWELWNEQNEHFFWRPKPDVARYAEWYRRGRDAILAENPSATVAAGGLAGLSNAGPEDVAGNEFLRLLYARAIFPDAVSVHPYSRCGPGTRIRFENNFTDIELIRATMDAAGQAGREVWITEWGWPGSPEAVQAEYLEQSLLLIAAQYPYVSVATYFLDHDRSNYSSGLYSRNFQLKEPGRVFRDFLLRRRAENAGRPRAPGALRIKQVTGSGCR